MRELTKVTKHNVVAFDYDALDPKVRQSVKSHAEQVNLLLQRTASSIIAIGNHLQNARGQLTAMLFQRWLFAEFGFATSTANRWMQVARHFGDLPAETVKRCHSTALFLLTKGDVAPKAIREALSIAQSGATLTAHRAAEIVHRHRPADHPAVNRNVQKGISGYVSRLTIGKKPEDLAKLSGELQRQAERLRTLAESNGHAAKNGKAPRNGKPSERHVYSVRVSLGRELDARETRLLRPLIENLLSEELDDAECQVEAIEAVAVA